MKSTLNKVVMGTVVGVMACGLLITTNSITTKAQIPSNNETCMEQCMDDHYDYGGYVCQYHCYVYPSTPLPTVTPRPYPIP